MIYQQKPIQFVNEARGCAIVVLVETFLYENIFDIMIGIKIKSVLMCDSILLN